MAYVPLNPTMFTAVFSAALAAMNASSRPFLATTVVADYSDLSNVAGAFAQKFDTTWALTPTNSLHIELAQLGVEALWETIPPPTDGTRAIPATYTRICNAIIAMMTAASAYYAGQGIVPPAVPTSLTPGGANRDVQYNNNGALGGITMGAFGTFLQTNGVSAFFGPAPAGAVPGGAIGAIQYNNAGTFGGITIQPQGYVLTSDGTFGFWSNPPIVFGTLITAPQLNIRSNRAIGQSTIDETKTGITCFGSASGLTVGTADEDYATVSGGAGNECHGFASTIVGGELNIAYGAHSTAGGDTCIAEGAGCVAFGSNNTVGQDFALTGFQKDYGAVFGVNHSALSESCFVAGAGHAIHRDSTAATAFGNNCTIGSGVFAATNGGALGASCVCMGSAAFAIGQGCEARGDGSVALAGACISNGAFSGAMGWICETTGSGSVALGKAARSLRLGEVANASGTSAATGDSQKSRFIVEGTSLNGAAISLTANGGTGLPLNLEDGKAYRITATAVANRTDAAGRASFENTLLVHCSAGAAVIDVDVPDPSAALFLNGEVWTLAYSASTNEILATFTGTVGQDVRANVSYTWVELGGGL